MMRSTFAIAMLLLANGLLTESPHAAEPTREFFVALNGNDANPGTKEAPLATVSKAQFLVREQISAGLRTDVRVLIGAGVYYLQQPLVFGPQDSGTAEHSVTYAAAPGETVVLSGGQIIEGWTKGAEEIWTAKCDGQPGAPATLRHLFVNGRRAVRARTPNQDAENPAWQLSGAELSSDLSQYTLRLPSGLIGKWSSPGNLEVMVAGNWEINRLPVQSLDPSTGIVILSPPHVLGHEAIRPGPERWCHFENAPEMLDQAGEWHFDRTSRTFSYWPRANEDLTKAAVIVPRLERLVWVKGTAEHPVQNLHFRGLGFEHVGWALPPGGYLGIQACHFTKTSVESGEWGRIPAAIRWDFTRRCRLEDCTLAHLGGCGIEVTSGCDDVVRGNDIFDVSGNGMMLGGPTSEAEVPKRVEISGNHVHACGVEFYGAVGIWVGFAQQARIAHNLVHQLPYSGVSVGWQWNPEPTPCRENLVEYNHIYDVMNRLCDGGCIYTLGFQPGTTIRGNHLHGAHRSQYAQGAPNNGMFIDAGSKGYLFEQNVIYDTAAELVRFNQCERDWHTWKDNYIGAKDEVLKAGRAIVEKAGLGPLGEPGR